MVGLIFNMIIALLVVGFLYLCYIKLIGLVPLEPTIRSVLDVLVWILVGAVILFYVIIPLLTALSHSISIPGIK